MVVLEWKFIVVRVSGPREVTEEGNILKAWGTGAVTQGGELVSANSKKQNKGLYEIKHDKRNWSWLLAPIGLSCLPPSGVQQGRLLVLPGEKLMKMKLYSKRRRTKL